MALGFGSSSDRKGKGAIRAEDEDDAGETSPLLGGQRSEAPAASRPQSAIVRHGRGLLSEDGDGASDTGNADHDNDDDDLSEDGEANGLLGWRRRRRSSSTRRRRRRPSAKSIACYIFIAFLGVAFIVFAIIHIWLGRFVSEQMKDNASLLRARAQDALIYRGPNSVKVLDMNSNTTTVQVQMSMGIDVRTVFGWNGTFDEERRLPLSRKLERKLVGWATRRVGQTSMDLPEPVLVSPQSHPNHPMMQFTLGKPVTLPMYFPKSDKYNISDLTWLRNITLTVPLEVVDPDLMAEFVTKTMDAKEAKVHVKVQKAHVTLGRENDRTWLTRTVRNYGGQSIEGIELDQTVELPDQPDIPKPEELVDLKSYTLSAIPHNITHGNHSDTEETLGIQATAQIKNPAFEQLHKLALDLSIPFAWPYKISLASMANKTERVLLARGTVQPFTIPSSSKYFNVSINGTVENSHNSSTPLSQSLSKFVTRFLGGRSNRVYVSFDLESEYAKKIPSFLTPLLKDREVFNDIPGLPAEERDLLKNPKMEHLRVHASESGGSGFEIDGEMSGEITMPQGLDQLDNAINITSIWPDILLYDGLPPLGNDDKVVPVPLPANAFARFKTRDWSPAITYVDPTNNATIMRATVTNVPLEILNRGVLQRWLAKIVFSGGNGVRTGIKGLTQAKATVRAFGGIELHKLPVYGTFLAQKPSAMEVLTSLSSQ